MTLKPCPRCGTLIQYGQPYCATCKPLAEADREKAREHRTEQLRKIYNKRYNAKRDTQTERAKFYRSKDWKITSRAKLQSCGYKCEARLEGCGRIACEVHHIKPLKTEEGWEKRLDWSNLMGVCVQCHNILDDKKFKKKKEEGVIDLSELSR